MINLEGTNEGTKSVKIRIIRYLFGYFASLIYGLRLREYRFGVIFYQFSCLCLPYGDHFAKTMPSLASLELPQKHVGQFYDIPTQTYQVHGSQNRVMS